MKAWGSRVAFDHENLTKRGEPKRKFERMRPGVRGLGASDQFSVMHIDPDGCVRQERIKVLGKPGKRLADKLADKITSELILNTYDTKRRPGGPNFDSSERSGDDRRDAPRLG